ncbi:MAG: hypothetical protein ABJ277_10795 [Flavobacteriaceae bacterium]
MSFNTTNVSLQWDFNDLDSGMNTYEVFRKKENPLIFLGIPKLTTLDTNVISRNSHHGQIVVMDTENNSSAPESFEFGIEYTMMRCFVSCFQKRPLGGAGSLKFF